MERSSTSSRKRSLRATKSVSQFTSSNTPNLQSHRSIEHWAMQGDSSELPLGWADDMSAERSTPSAMHRGTEQPRCACASSTKRQQLPAVHATHNLRWPPCRMPPAGDRQGADLLPAWM